jgi:hypothetical protein
MFGDGYVGSSFCGTVEDVRVYVIKMDGWMYVCI